MEKKASEYLSDRNRLMSKIEVVCQNLEKTSSKLYKLIVQFLLFQYSCVNIREKKGIPRAMTYTLQRVLTG